MSLQELGHHRTVVLSKALTRIILQHHFMLKRNLSQNSYLILTRSAANRHFVHTVYETFVLLGRYVA
jgi:hypothetical protein